MTLKRVTHHFLAALGLEVHMEKAAQACLEHFYRKVLISYSQEVRVERARLMRQSPLDYRRVRDLDRELDDVTTRLRDAEAGQARSTGSV